ncbi:MAG TPA: histidine kinase [Geobacter sp.]|nr:histidine kinase [Geobacter sp.]
MALRILVAEDDPTIRHMMVIILSRQGFDCSSVEDGRQAVEAWERDHFDLIIMDVQMPVMDGLNATRIIRKEEAVRGGHIPIIATTAFALDGDRQMCREAGMDEYVSKPLHLELLLGFIDKHMKRRPEDLP